MKNCPFCKSVIPKTSLICPRCGNQIKQHSNKGCAIFWTIIFIAIITIFIIVVNKILNHVYIPHRQLKGGECEFLESDVTKSFPGITKRKLTPEIIHALKVRMEYKEMFKTNKKMIKTVTGGPSCPYKDAFFSALKKATSDPEIKQNYIINIINGDQIVTYGKTYSFETEEEKQAFLDEGKEVNRTTPYELKFNNEICNEFCIINPRTNELYSFNGIGAEEGEMVYNLLLVLKDW